MSQQIGVCIVNPQILSNSEAVDVESKSEDNLWEAVKGWVRG